MTNESVVEDFRGDVCRSWEDNTGTGGRIVGGNYCTNTTVMEYFSGKKTEMV